MPGRKQLPGLVCLLCLPVCSCTGEPRAPAAPAPPAAVEAGTFFDPSTAGTIEGRVTWIGEPPTIPLLRGWTDVASEGIPAKKHEEPNPNAPRIDPVSGGIGNAVVFLRGVDPRRGRPWDLPPVRVQQRDYRLLVQQGDAADRDGFVRRGDRIEMVSTGPVFHVLHATGAAYFSLAFPEPDRPRSHSLDRPGVVELASGAGYFWMRAYLFVDDHPYYTPSDALGRFRLPQVPPGRYEVVCWLPDWHEAGHDRDPETSLVVRVKYRPPVEHVQALEVGPNRTEAVQFTWGLKDF